MFTFYYPRSDFGTLIAMVAFTVGTISLASKTDHVVMKRVGDVMVRFAGSVQHYPEPGRFVETLVVESWEEHLRAAYTNQRSPKSKGEYSR